MGKMQPVVTLKKQYAYILSPLIIISFIYSFIYFFYTSIQMVHTVAYQAGAGGRVPPETSGEISDDLRGKKRQKRQGKKGKGVRIEKKRRKIVKRKVENWKLKVEKFQKPGEDLFFLFFFLTFQNH